jgi:hypothetical protein
MLTMGHGECRTIHVFGASGAICRKTQKHFFLLDKKEGLIYDQPTLMNLNLPGIIYCLPLHDHVSW